MGRNDACCRELLHQQWQRICAGNIRSGSTLTGFGLPLCLLQGLIRNCVSRIFLVAFEVNENFRISGKRKMEVERVAFNARILSLYSDRLTK